jgi:hypothetical protein
VRLSVFTLVGIAAFFTGCATGSGATGGRDEKVYSLQGPGPSARQSSDQQDSTTTSSFGQSSSTLTQQAVLDTVKNVVESPGGLASSRSLLVARTGKLGTRAGGLFIRHIAYGSNQLPWLNRALSGATRLANASSQVDDPDMELGLLRLTGPRLEAAMLGSLVLAAWLDFLQLAEVVLQQCPFYSVERLFRDLDRVQRLLEPSMAALASLEPRQVEATAAALPSLMGQLTREFQSIQETARVASERGGQMMAAAQLFEMLVMASTLKLSLPRGPPAAPAMLSVGLVMGTDGVLMGSRIVVSAEWVERMHQLVQAGVISAPVVSTAVRIHAGQMLMAQSNQDLPKGVREALGEGPEVDGMRVTGKAGAGMAERPQHHVMPDEHRAWFEKRGFIGEMNIDQFCVELEAAHHQAIHGGGNWRLGRTWPGEWNQLIMKALQKAETRAGRTLTRNEILNLVGEHMRNYDIPIRFTPWRGR